MTSIPPHGGQLVNRIATGSEREKILSQISGLPKITLNNREMSDLDMIACGALSPLEGFMGKMDYESVVEFMRLNNGLPWTIPITLAVKEGDAGKYEIGKQIALFSEGGEPLAVLSLEEKFKPNKE